MKKMPRFATIALFALASAGVTANEDTLLRAPRVSASIGTHRCLDAAENGSENRQALDVIAKELCDRIVSGALPVPTGKTQVRVTGKRWGTGADCPLIVVEEVRQDYFCVRR
jgi:hypothetical protein